MNGFVRSRFVAFLLGVSLGTSVFADKAWHVTTRGWGAVAVGSSRTDVERLLRTRLVGGSPELEPSCEQFKPESGYSGIGLMFRAGKLARVEILNSTVQTVSGAKVGDSTDRLRQIYGSRVSVKDHEYDENSAYYFIWEEKGKYGVKFEIESGKVIAIYAGDKSIQLVEGCS